MGENRYRIPGDFKLRALGKYRAFEERIDWSHKFLGTGELSNRGTIHDKPLRVCILDTGFDKHDDLKGSIVNSKDFTGSSVGVKDVHGHGTWCAGFIGARANKIGVRGIVPDCEMLIGKVLGDDGSGSETAIAKGLEWGYSNEADVFSLSLGGPRMSDALYNLIKQLAKHGKLIFVASGNDGGSVNYPAAWPECIAVGAVDKEGKLTDFTSRGDELDILGPGYEMESLGLNGGYATMSGTSMATPCVAAIATSVLGAHEEAGNSKLRSPELMTLKLQEYGSTVDRYKLVNPRKLMQELNAEAGNGINIGIGRVHIPARAGDWFSVGK